MKATLSIIVAIFIFTELISWALYKKGKYKKTAIFSMFLFLAINIYTILIILDIVSFGLLFGGDPSNKYYIIALFIGIPLFLNDLVLLVDTENKNLKIYKCILIFLNSFSSIVLLWSLFQSLMHILVVSLAYLFLIVPILISIMHLK